MKKLHFIIVVLLFIRTPVVLGLDIKGEKKYLLLLLYFPIIGYIPSYLLTFWDLAMKCLS